MAIDPTEAQASALADTPMDEPVIFINCHRYHPEAIYPADYISETKPANVSGKEAHHRYLWSVERDFMPQVGGRFLFAGPVELVLIGHVQWDEVIIGEYPSKQEAFRMQTLPGYEDINVLRAAGLAEVMTLSFTQAQMERLAIPDAWINRS